MKSDDRKQKISRLDEFKYSSEEYLNGLVRIIDKQTGLFLSTIETDKVLFAHINGVPFDTIKYQLITTGLLGKFYLLVIKLMWLIAYVITFLPKKITEFSKNIFNSFKNQKSRPVPHFLLFFAGLIYPAKQRDSMLGDVEEIFRKDVVRVGAFKARLFLILDILRSYYPILREFLRTKIISFLKHIGLHVVVKYFLG